MSARLREIARETVECADRGWYPGPDGTRVPIDVAVAVAGTRLHLPDDPLPEPVAAPAPPVVEVTGETSLAAAARLGGDVACLVFASAKNPGGGFRTGAKAQEESIARASALYHCQLAAGDFYTHHRTHARLIYSDRVIHSPRVPVFRDDGGAFLPAPYPVSFLTAAAPNRVAVGHHAPDLLSAVPGVLARRAARVVAVAAAHGHRRIVLGAWGCGVFGNDPAVVAAAFAPHLGVFEHVVFAVHGRDVVNRAAFAGLSAPRS
ncbi:TIGR02452 family protein [Spirilliplanes yamanashiensis]|uniref:TIGR02452 family protein n=1 Tax=Spirilliplanes yamanashiensis TaxID=42233 RepID=A0A8J3YAG8_9ACTN|nr:TIGR02452 family protein [Spirilliplanes yamanashiensis]MDP9817694.1 uncharacterized protein (TIGR02452 family) [Spirilliplanes yamanashiensis]GIJ04504.1 TIGR02452 family protein [Spirilliplanes yamanashiensis]